MSKRISLFAGLSALLAACGTGSTPNPNPTPTPIDLFFSTQPTFEGTLPPGTTTTTPEQFMALVGNGAKVVTADDLRAAREAQKAQQAADDTEAAAYVDAHPDFKALLNPAGDSEKRATVATESGSKTVTLMGNAFGRSVLATHARLYASRENQSQLYADLYPDLDTALKQLDSSAAHYSLPTPAETAKMSAAQLQELNGQLADLAYEFRGGLSGLKVTLPSANGETGSADQLDRTQKGSCETAAAGGLLQNFSWPLKTLTTSVKDQGTRGTCWGFASIAALEAQIAKRDHKMVNLSEQDYVAHRLLEWAPRAYGDGGDPVYIAQKASEANYVLPYEAGWQYNKSDYRVENAATQTYSNSCTGYTAGVCSDTNYQGYLLSVPYLNTKTGKSGVHLIKSLPKIGQSSGYRLRSPSNFWDVSQPQRNMAILLLRSVLGGATVITLDMRYVKPTANSAPSMSSMRPDENGFVPTQTMRKLADGSPDWELDHVMTVTGFISSREIRRALPNQLVADDYGYFIVKNSWGDCWGDQGYVYLPWTWVQTFVGEASTGLEPQ